MTVAAPDGHEAAPAPTGRRSLAGRVAVVTGAGAGIGAATARRLSEEGALVTVVDIDGTAARRVAEGLPGENLWVAGDVAREADVARYLDETVNRFGRVDLHHLNAGISGVFAALPDVAVEDFNRVLSVNMTGTFLGIRGAFRQYRAQGSGGAIVLTASIASLRGSADLLAYHASKHGTLGLMRNAAVYGGPLGIRVNAVAPGIVPTGLFAGAGAAVGGGDDMVRRASTTPLRRAGTPEDIAAVVAFLLSEDAAYVTGEVISVDGGATAVNTVRPSGGAGAWDTAAYDQQMYGITNSSQVD